MKKGFVSLSAILLSGVYSYGQGHLHVQESSTWVLILIVLLVSNISTIVIFRWGLGRNKKYLELTNLLEESKKALADAKEELYTQTEELAKHRYMLEVQNDKLTSLNKELTFQKDEIEAQNFILNKQKSAISEQNLLLDDQNDEIEAQKNELKHKNEELEIVNKTKDKFFSIIAHDLRNPLNAMIGFADLLNSSFDSFPEAKKKKFIDIIFTSSKNLLALLENLLHWARSQCH